MLHGEGRQALEERCLAAAVVAEHYRPARWAAVAVGQIKRLARSEAADALQLEGEEVRGMWDRYTSGSSLPRLPLALSKDLGVGRHASSLPRRTCGWAGTACRPRI